MPRRKSVILLAPSQTTRQTLWFSTAVRQAVVKAVEQQVGVALAAIQAQQKQRTTQEASGTAIYGNNVVNVFQIERLDGAALEMLLRRTGADTH